MKYKSFFIIISCVLLFSTSSARSIDVLNWQDPDSLHTPNVILTQIATSKNDGKVNKEVADFFVQHHISLSFKSPSSQLCSTENTHLEVRLQIHPEARAPPLEIVIS